MLNIEGVYIMSNFEFLKSFDTQLFEEGSKSEKQFVAKDYDNAIQTLRKFTEGIILYAAKKEGFPSRKSLSQRIKYMLKVDYINDDLSDMFHLLRSAGNDASHFNKVKFDRQDVLTRLQDAFFVARWLYNRYTTKKIRNDFDLTKLESQEEPMQKATPVEEENSPNGMLKIVKGFFDLVARNSPSQEIVGDTGVMEIKVDNRSIPYMVLLRKFTNDKVSNALYPAIYVYKGFDVAFTVYGKGGYCHENWGEIETSKPLIQKYFEENGQIDQVIQQNPKFNYLDNHYAGVYRLSKLGKDTYQLIADDFEKIQAYLKEQRGE